MGGDGLHRKVLVAWSIITLLVLLWMLTRPRDGESLSWIWIPVLLTPILTLLATFTIRNPPRLSLVYWVIAAFTIPNAAGGLTSFVGPMFIVTIILLVWAARRENPSEEIVQM